KVKRALIEFNPDNLKIEVIEVVTVNRCGEIIQRQERLAKYFVENLVNGINLEMAYIPGGTFMMGLPEDEYERPQHEVTVKPFYMGKFTVTQAQWEVIAELPKIERKLKLDPSDFKGDNWCRSTHRFSHNDEFELIPSLSNDQYHIKSKFGFRIACDIF
ncbi:MAG: formylglycine-generating enzyme family protein, partial [Cyanobacteria bacterium J06621_15]